MAKAKSGDKVKIHITGKLENGTVLSSSKDNGPVEIALGQSNIINGIQEAVIGMEPQESKTVKVPPKKGFGQYRDDLIKDVPKELLPEDVSYEAGNTVELPQTNGKMGQVKVMDVSDAKVKLDLNHPLAGKDLVFDITLLEIV